MIKYLKTITLLLLCTFLLTGTSLASGYKKHTITVATASNALKAVEAITELFTKESGVEVVIVSGSTGKLYSQIVMGAPYDVFLAADKKRPKLLFDKELTKGEPFTYAKGSLIFWSAKSVPGMGEYGLDLLLDDDIKRIAIANPKTAPYGAAAVEVLKNSGLYEQVEAKLVYGESVSHTVGFVLSRNVDVALTALSSTFGFSGEGILVQRKLYTPILQDGVVLKHSHSDALLFKQFLGSEKARKILKKYGY